MQKIKWIKAVEILASSGLPTLEVEIELEGGNMGKASVAYGVSAGVKEAVTKFDGDLGRYNGKGMLKACKLINEGLTKELIGIEWEQKILDEFLVKKDGTENMANLGGNVTLAISLAYARAAAVAEKLEVFEYLQKVYDLPKYKHLPSPMAVMIEGGKHADNSTDFQEYLLDCVGGGKVAEKVQIMAQVYQKLEEVLKREGFSTNVGKEGAFAPEGINSNSRPIELISMACQEAGYTIGKEVFLSIDMAASEFFTDGFYTLNCEKKRITAEQMADYYEELNKKFNLYSIEDPLEENSWEDWKMLLEKLSVKLVGDDLTVSKAIYIQKAGEEKACGMVIIKPNQVGTLSQTIEACKKAREFQMGIIISHRGGGETTDTFIADLAVAVGAEFIKCGPARGERVEKYNRLMEIERNEQN